MTEYYTFVISLTNSDANTVHYLSENSGLLIVSFIADRSSRPGMLIVTGMLQHCISYHTKASDVLLLRNHSLCTHTFLRHKIQQHKALFLCQQYADLLFCQFKLSIHLCCLLVLVQYSNRCKQRQ